MQTDSCVACIFGASFICIDLIIRQFPGMRHFRIQDSDAFLSTSLSLSFGVMVSMLNMRHNISMRLTLFKLFSALYSMLPSSKRSLQEGGYSPKEAAWIMVACFIGGVAGIQILSNVLHRFIPHDIVDCEHTHEDEELPKENGHSHGQEHDHDNGHGHDSRTPKVRKTLSQRRITLPGHVPSVRRNPPRASSYFGHVPQDGFAPTVESEAQNHPEALTVPRGDTGQRRPSLYQRLTAGITNIASGKDMSCDCNGPCYGFGDLCGSECFKNVNARGRFGSSATVRQIAINDSTTNETTPLLGDIAEEDSRRPHTRAAPERLSRRDREDAECLEIRPSDDSSDTTGADADHASHLHKTTSQEVDVDELPEHHHHHVPKNAFMSIGLQTSIAIALHKLPEGFITYATNHANPKLGVSVFLALFIHNITEGFALALPLYLAINSRLKAMLISFVLGGLSQPIGAGVAALWFKLAGTSNWAPSEAVYGGMFAATAGIMASVALQLFSESLDLTHSKALCMVGAFTGMTILGISGALTA